MLATKFEPGGGQEERGLTNHRADTSNWSIRRKDQGHDHRAVLIRYQLTYGHIETQLDGLSQTVDCATGNQCVDVLSS